MQLFKVMIFDDPAGAFAVALAGAFAGAVAGALAGALAGAFAWAFAGALNLLHNESRAPKTNSCETCHAVLFGGANLCIILTQSPACPSTVSSLGHVWKSNIGQRSPLRQWNSKTHARN